MNLLQKITKVFRKTKGIRKTYHVDPAGVVYWKVYDENDNIVYYRDSNGTQYWKEYSENGYKIHYYNSDGKEYWENYDDNCNFISYTVPNPSYPLINYGG